MADYSNPNTPLTARRYHWSGTFTRRPIQSGRNPSQDCTGNYDTQPGATVGSLLNGLIAWYAKQNNVPRDQVVLVRYTIREK